MATNTTTRNRRLLTVAEASLQLGISAYQVRKLVNAGVIAGQPRVTKRSMQFITQDAIDAYLDAEAA